MTEISALEQRRNENIARNNRFLEELGLGPDLSSSSSRSKPKPKPKPRKRKELDGIDVAAEPERRSYRIKSHPAPYYGSNDALLQLADHQDFGGPSRKSSRMRKPINYSDDIGKGVFDEFDRASNIKVEIDEHGDVVEGGTIDKGIGNGKGRESLVERPLAEGDTSRALNADLEAFLNPKALCMPTDMLTKASVMLTAYPSSRARFSKYSGVVEWANAVFLWVNVGGTQCDYPNEMREGGQVLSWFGGSRHHEDSPVVQRLLTEKNVMLFVRFEKEGYSCLGRLATVKALLDRHPVSFLFRLLDYERVKELPFFLRVRAAMGCPV